MRVKAIIYDFDGPVNDSFREGMRRIKILCAANNVRFGHEQRRLLAEHWGMPGAKEVLDWAKRNGFVSCLLTTRNRDHITGLLRRLDLERRFDIMSSNQDAVYRKPDPRAFWHLQQELHDRFGITLPECVFVGDTANDIRAGKAAGVRPLVVMNGPYLADGAERVDHPDMLPSIDALPEWMRGQCTGKKLKAFV